MKTQSQAGGKNSRRAKFKQARKVAGESRQAITEPTTARRRPLTPEQEKGEADIVRFIEKEERKELENVVRGFLLGGIVAESLTAAFGEITRSELNAVARLCFKLKQSESGVVSKSLFQTFQGMENTHSELQAIFYLLVANMERLAFAQKLGIQGITSSTDEANGFLILTTELMRKLGVQIEQVRGASNALKSVEKGGAR